MSTHIRRNLEEAIKDFSEADLKSFLLWCSEQQASPTCVALTTWKNVMRYTNPQKTVV